MASIGLVAIQSVVFPWAFLRMVADNVTQSEGNGSGQVNCQFYGQPNNNPPNNPPPVVPVANFGCDEVFELIPLPGGVQGGYALRSMFRPQAFLRMDGRNVTQFESNGSGTVNCQYYSDAYPQVNTTDLEHLVVIRINNNRGGFYYAIQSGQSPHAFLRIEAGNFTAFDGNNGGGTVNCQFYDLHTDPNTGATVLPALNSFEIFNIIYSHHQTLSNLHNIRSATLSLQLNQKHADALVNASLPCQ
jgi:hypothetical protein